MIQTNELRIGNFAEFNHHTDRIGIITWIQEHSIEITYLSRCEEDLSNGAIVSPNSLIPIPLTPEILEKCGFEKHGEWYQLKNHQVYPLVINISFKHNVTTLGCNEEYGIDYGIKSLHQLQNLYHALTGEELNYTP